MSRRAGVSLVETLVVVAILGTLLALFLPSVLSTRNRALELECKNHLHQINLAIADYAETHKRFPASNPKDKVGGWSIEILPFLEQKNLRDKITVGQPITSAPAFLLRQPRVFRCPMRELLEETPANAMEASCYVFLPGDKRKTYHVSDAPTDLKAPWASGPELNLASVLQRPGPHHGGFYLAAGFQHGVDFVAGN